MTMHRPTVLAASILLAPLFLHAQDKLESSNSSDANSAEKALKSIAVTPGLKLDLWAAEPMIENCVAFSFDEKGRCFVAETNRRRTSVPDIRGQMKWLPSSLAFRSYNDRVAFMKEAYPIDGPQKVDKGHPDYNKDGKFDWRDFEVESERIQVLEDRKGAGHADTASEFAEGFNTVGTGVGAGVLARDGHVWYTVNPDLWKMDANSTTASKRESLAHGFGVHIVSSGHDMHGVKMGPDGRIYWSIADCGARVTTREGKLIDIADMGGVFRINPDGTDMELVARGMRNPQSLAFNDVGDLFTGDNNSDLGDRARWLHVVEGAEYGWRNGFQYMPAAGVWLAEKLWELDTGKTAPYLLPPVGHVTHGPAGIAWYPGTGLPDSYREHFFAADFPGGVRTFTIHPQGASYTLDNPNNVLLDNNAKQMNQKVLWSLYPSDVGFGCDGGLYVLDWVFGWEKTGKGRIFRVHDPEVDKSEIVQQTKKLLAEGMAGKADKELVRLMGHVDQRVRLNAQFALAAKGAPAIPLLAKVAKEGNGDPKGAAAGASAASHVALARLHAIWALGQISRKSPQAVDAIAALLKDSEAEARAQAAKLLGEAKRPQDEAAMIALLKDPEPRPRFFAAMALSKLGTAAAVKPLLELVKENDDRDPYLRHAAVMGLVTCANAEALDPLVHDPSEAIRTAVLLTLRRQKSAVVAEFLHDSNAGLVREAARAIHDERIDAAFPQLAALASQPTLPAPVAKRAVDANYVLGTAAAAQRLAGIATGAGDEKARVDALDALSDWKKPEEIDRVLGIWRPLPATRDPQAATAATAPILTNLLESPLNSLRLAAAEAAANLKISAAEPALLTLAADTSAAGNVRAAALRALEATNSPKLSDAVKSALDGKDKALVQETSRLSARLSPNEAAAHAGKTLETGSVDEKQSAFEALGDLSSPEADKLLAVWLDRLAAGKVPPAVHLDLLEAAGKRSDALVKQKLAAYEAKRVSTDPLARWQECMEGGDAKLGSKVFEEKAEAACVRCHKIRGKGGDVGPDLGHIASQHDRIYILTSIVQPNAAIAPGYENLLLTLKDGNLVAGLRASEDAESLTLTPLDGSKKVTVKKRDIAQRTTAPSPMPEGLADALGKRDLRNLVEYLASLK